MGGEAKDFVEENYTNDRRTDCGAGGEMADKTFYGDKENSYPCFPKFHLTWSSGWTAHGNTKF